MSAPATRVAVLTTVTIQMVAIIVGVAMDIDKVAKTVMVSENCLCVAVYLTIFDDWLLEQNCLSLNFEVNYCLAFHR